MSARCMGKISLNMWRVFWGRKTCTVSTAALPWSKSVTLSNDDESFNSFHVRWTLKILRNHTLNWSEYLTKEMIEL